MKYAICRYVDIKYNILGPEGIVNNILMPHCTARDEIHDFSIPFSAHLFLYFPE